MYISEQEVRAVLTYEALIPAIRQALIDYSSGRVNQPARMIMRAGNASDFRNGWFAVMPVVAGDLMAVKTVTFFAGKSELGIHTHMAVVELLSRTTGEPLAVMDGRLITEMRTAAVSAVSFEVLAPLHFDSAPTSLGIFGAGIQARAHIEALKHVWPELRDVRVCSRTRESATRLAEEMNVLASSPEEVLDCDVVLAATSSPTPVVRGSLLRPDALVLAVGATGSSVRELDDEAMLSSYLIAEARDCVGRESGDVTQSGAKVQAEIGEILCNPASARVPRNGRVLFKSVGMAIEDLTASRIVWQARQKGYK